MSARTALAMFFALLAAAAVAGLWWAWHHPPQLVMPTTAPTNPPLTTSGVAAFEMPALAHYAEVVERPVFIEVRRPQDNEAETTPPPPADPAATEPLRLIGVLLLPDRAAALILPEEPDPATVANDPALKKRIPKPPPAPQKHKVMRVAQGGNINGWVLETVQPDKVTLRKGGEVRELALLRPPKTKPRPSDGEPNPPLPGSIPPPSSPPPIPPPPTAITPPPVVPPAAPGSPTSGL